MIGLGHGVAAHGHILHRYAVQPLERHGQCAGRVQRDGAGRAVVIDQRIAADGQTADGEGVRHGLGLIAQGRVVHGLRQPQAAGLPGVGVLKIGVGRAVLQQRYVGQRRRVARGLQRVAVDGGAARQIEHRRRGGVGGLGHGVGVGRAALRLHRQILYCIAALGRVGADGHIRAAYDGHSRAVGAGHGEGQPRAHGGQLVGGQAARQRLAQRQVGVPGHGRRRLGAEPDLIQQVALAPVPLAAGQRQEEEPADILPRPDRVVAAVDAPLVVAVGDLTADHKAADGDLLAVVLHGPVQRRAHQKSPVVVLAGSARQNVGDLRCHIHRRDEQRHRVLHTPAAGAVGQRPVQRGAGRGQHILIQCAVGLAVQLGKLLPVVSAVDAVAGLGVVPRAVIAAVGAVRQLNVQAGASGFPVPGHAGGLPDDAPFPRRVLGKEGAGLTVRGMIQPGCGRIVVFVVIRLQPGNIRRFKAAVLQLDAVGHLHGRGGEFCAVGAGDLDLIVQPFRIPDTGNAGIQRSVQPVLAARRDVPRIAGAELLRDFLPVGAVLAAVPGVHSAVESVRAAVDLRCKAAVGPNAVHQLCACDNGSLRRGVGRGEQRIHHEGACGLGRCRGVSRRGRLRLHFGFRGRRVRVGGRNRRRRLRRGGQFIRRKHSVGHACRHTAGQQHSQQTFFHVRFLLCWFPARGLSPRRVNWEYTVRRSRNTSRAAFFQKVTKKRRTPVKNRDAPFL